MIQPWPYLISKSADGIMIAFYGKLELEILLKWLM